MNAERFVERLWYESNADAGPGRRLIEAVLRPMGAAWAAGAGVKELIYQRGWRRKAAAAAPVISIGNLTVGGTGKSTLCLELAGRLEAGKRRVAVISHAYGGSMQGDLPLIFSGACCPSTRIVGDEAVMLARGNPRLIIIAGADKSLAYAAAGSVGAEVIIIDDAFHRLDLRRDLDIVLVDNERGFGNGRCLPAGPLREPVTALRRADLVMMTMAHEEKINPRILDAVRAVRPDLPVIRGIKEPRRWISWRTGETVSETDMAGRSVFAFCGVGNPDSVKQSLDIAGVATVGLAAFGDHHVYTLAEMEEMARRAGEVGATAVVITEKDAVKIPQWPASSSPLYILAIGLRIDDPEGALDGALARRGIEAPA